LTFFVLRSLFFVPNVRLITRIERFSAHHSLWRPETRVVAAVSGGSDSVALLHILNDLSKAGVLRLDSVAHLNHATRGDASDGDEAFCRSLADALGVPCIAERVDVPQRARQERLSIEVAARQARQAFLERVRASRGADRIATAHTADDQAETVLLRLVRGAGLRGLGGIAPSRDVWIRPLLSVSRAELRDELVERGQTWREDSSNLDLANPRNRVRHELLPYLAREFNPSARDALTRLADLARADEAALEAAAKSAAASVLHLEGDSVRVTTEALSALPEAIQRRIVRQAVEMLGPGAAPGLDDVDAVRSVAAGERAAAEICGLRVEPSGAFVVLVRSGLVPPAIAPFRFELPIPGVVHFGAGWTLEAEGPINRQSGFVSGSSEQVAVDAAGLDGGLVVRNRQPGDRLTPLGLAGRKKVQDVFVDRKVARDERDQVPIVTDRNGRIVWVAGHVLAEEFRVTGGTNTVVILKLRRA